MQSIDVIVDQATRKLPLIALIRNQFPNTSFAACTHLTLTREMRPGVQLAPRHAKSNLSSPSKKAPSLRPSNTQTHHLTTPNSFLIEIFKKSATAGCKDYLRRPFLFAYIKISPDVR